MWLLFAVIAFSQQLPLPGWSTANKEGIQCPLLVQHGAADGHPAMAPHQGQLTLLSPCPLSGSATQSQGLAVGQQLLLLLVGSSCLHAGACAIAVPKSSQEGREEFPRDSTPRPRCVKVR